jgi:hypothetical protein
MPTEIVLKGTQPCEAVNNADVIMAPQNQHYSSTCSLENRSNTMVGSHNLGESEFYLQISNVIIASQMCMNLLAYLELKWGRKVSRRSYESQKSVKLKRTEQGKAKLKTTIKEKMVEEALRETFGEGDIDAHKSTMALMTTDEVDEFKKEKAKLLMKALRKCPSCGIKGHWDRRDWMCPQK